MSITQFTMEEVRCFGERQTLEIRPLTFLVGENNTGKTTALGCFHVLANFMRGRGVVFNSKPSDSHPYSMGTFKDIVRNSKRKDKVFKLGFSTKYANDEISWIIEFIERKGGVQPTVDSVNIEFNDGRVVFNIVDESDTGISLDSYNEKHNQYYISCVEQFFTRFEFWEILDLLDEITISSKDF